MRFILASALLLAAPVAAQTVTPTNPAVGQPVVITLPAIPADISLDAPAAPSSVTFTPSVVGVHTVTINGRVFTVTAVSAAPSPAPTPTPTPPPPPPSAQVVGSISVTIAPSMVTAGQTAQATAVVRDTNGQPMSVPVTWSVESGHDPLASINASGLVTSAWGGVWAQQNRPQAGLGIQASAGGVTSPAAFLIVLNPGTVVPDPGPEPTPEPSPEPEPQPEPTPDPAPDQSEVLTKLNQILAAVTKETVACQITSLSSYANGDQRLTVRCAPSGFVRGSVEVVK